MALIDVMNLKKEYGSQLLFENVKFSIDIGDRIAVIGDNGTGKSTLLKIILGQEFPDSGQVYTDKGITIGYLSQGMITSLNHTLFDEISEVFADLEKMEAQLKELQNQLTIRPNDEILLNKYGKIEHTFMEKDGYQFHYHIDYVLSKFGFSKGDYLRKISSFSGGEKSKVAFAKLLLTKPSVLMLDEPTNHLDVSTVEWLEDYLIDYPGAILIVSHDRYFIDHVCDEILEIEHHSMERYGGNYSFYLQEKVIRYEQRLKAFKMQEEEIEHLEELIKKFKPKPTKVTLARDREKKLAKIMQNKIEKPSLNKSNVHFLLDQKEFRRYQQITINDLSLGFDSKALFTNFSSIVFNNDKIGIIGDNGVGKTTLLKAIYGKIQQLSGKIHHHRPLKFGYIDQNQITITSEESLFDNFHNEFPHFTNLQVRKQLAKFLFTGEDVFKSISALSGGEKVRLSFSKLLLKKYDILLLDEPTNHLDLNTKKVLESALKEYIGTIIFVSHDRYFIDEVASKLWCIENNLVEEFEGDYISYKKMKKISKEISLTSETKKESLILLPKNKKTNKNRKVLEEALIKIEKQITELQNQLQESGQEYTYYQEIEKKLKEAENICSSLEEEYLQLID